jgi:hypothetical protein
MEYRKQLKGNYQKSVVAFLIWVGPRGRFRWTFFKGVRPYLIDCVKAKNRFFDNVCSFMEKPFISEDLAG